MTAATSVTSNRPAAARCAWATSDPAMVTYHDEVWGVPLHDDRALFGSLTLQTFQSGLSWRTILHKQAAFEEVFDNFEPRVVARYGLAEVDRLLADARIVRNRRKIEAAIANAGAALDAAERVGSFDAYVWDFVGYTPIVSSPRRLSDIMASTPESDAMSRQMRADGFTFVGPVVAYAFMQASGLVNDHVVDCLRYAELTGRR